jgi:hypothetical protein
MRLKRVLRVAATSILVPWLIGVAILALVGLTFVPAGARPSTPQTALHFAIIGDYGSQGQAEADVSTLVHGWNPELIITTGDNNYDLGDESTIDPNIGQYYHDYIYPYTGVYGQGAPYNKFFPSLGNHDWNTAGATPYLSYFTLPGNERYYDFAQGPVHFYAVDSDPSEPDGINSTSAQAAWLRSALAASTEPWKLVYFHHPAYSSGASHGNTPALQWPYQAWGASLVLSGHEHNYERLMFNGFPYIINGLGGRSLYGFGTPLPQSVVRYASNYGAMVVDATSITMTLKFVARTGTVVDTYTMTAPLTPTPTATRTPTVTRTPTLTATPAPLLVGHVSWQGRPAQPSTLQQLPVTLTLKLGATEANYPAQMTDASGNFTVSLGALPPGTYNWRAKGPQYLANAGSVALGGPSAPITSVEVGLVRAGDCDNDNLVSVTDFSILKNAFGRTAGDPGYDPRADFTGDGTVAILDFTLQKNNFAQSGAPPVGPVR